MAKDTFTNGVRFYSTGKAEITVGFPEDDICCHWCKFCRAESDLNRFWCRLTNDMIYNPFVGLADTCPLQFDEFNGEEFGE
ncbi:hypothetical protein [Ruminococcus sp.]|uniref:hypothetical protein n=1 Tax=Ruminococcus sp. TaxID=41978 RepID=UPI0026225CC7|nr:hypothetical protein [Ruminococcus sp.]MDD6988740.1 hypothetical protein [Ruminococcus sp.]